MASTNKHGVLSHNDNSVERWTREKAVAEVMKYRSSGLKMKDYAAKAGVSMNILRGWAAQLSRQKRKPTPVSKSSQNNGFVQLEVAGGPSPSPVSEIVLVSGLRLVLREGVGMDGLRTLVNELGAASC